jgi:hypothetical protein
MCFVFLRRPLVDGVSVWDIRDDGIASGPQLLDVDGIP